MAPNGMAHRGRGKVLLAWIGAGLSVLYLANPSFGVFELLPDNIPGLGNLDEAAATALLIACLRTIVHARRDRLAAAGGGPVQPPASRPAVRVVEKPHRS